MENPVTVSSLERKILYGKGERNLVPSSEEKNQQLGESSVQKENSLTAMKQFYQQHKALQVVPWHLVELQPSAYTQRCKSYCNYLKSQYRPAPSVVGLLACFAPCLSDSFRCCCMSVAVLVLICAMRRGCK